jgi:hypothetical protein
MVKATQLSIFVKILPDEFSFSGYILDFFFRQNKHAYCLTKQQADFSQQL